MTSINSYECSTTSLGSSSLVSSMSCSTPESKTNLIVNYLPQTMTCDELRVIFQSVGSIESCKLIKDKVTQQSLCYGFINYSSVDDADKAVKKFNGLQIENKTIKVSYARPSCESIKGANLYICGMPKKWTVDDMNNYFGQCGRIITSRILFNSSGQSKGVGFIRYDQRHEADLAIIKLNGTLPESGASEPVTVKFANYPLELKNKMVTSLGFDYFSGVKLNSSPTTPTNLTTFRPLNNNANTASQASMLTPTSASLFNPRFPFYNTNDLICNNENLFQPTVINPVLAQTQQQQQQQVLTQSSASLASSHQPSWCLFVYNLCSDMQESVLWQLFGPFGAVQNVRIIRDHQNKSRGFGFVTMSAYESALNAINSLNGIILSNRVLQVSFKINTSFRN